VVAQYKENKGLSLVGPQGWGNMSSLRQGVLA